jgi:hypothetical protein
LASPIGRGSGGSGVAEARADERRHLLGVDGEHAQEALGGDVVYIADVWTYIHIHARRVGNGFILAVEDGYDSDCIRVLVQGTVRLAHDDIAIAVHAHTGG